jgi:hypothetical protein
MRSGEEMAPWETVSRKAYWDREVPLETWRKMVSLGHASYLPDAVVGLGVAEFAHFYGVAKFIQEWPALRAQLPEKLSKKTGMYDLVWSKLASGGWNLRPVADFTTMPKRRRQFFVEVACSPGKSIYEVAQSLGMQYRRAHDHAVKLIEDRKIRGAEVIEGGHRKTKLYPSYP